MEILRDCAVGGMPHDHDDANIGIVSKETLDATGQIDVGRCGVQQQLMRETMSEIHCEIILGWA
jgi:hypothetical protein